MADTFEVGQKLVSLCREGKNLEAIDSLYATDVVSIEVMGDETMPARMEGIDAVRKKNQWWVENHTVHSGEVSGPFPHGKRFIVVFKTDITPKVGPMAGKRIQLEECGLYTLRDGKVAKEEFFYHFPT